MHALQDISTVDFSDQETLSIEQFITMDLRAMKEYFLPVELMMENAGLQLARMVTLHASGNSKILIGVGVGNNGGGGLVAARRLAGWGYRVNLDIPDSHLKPIPASQLNRAIAFGAINDSIDHPDIFVDAYFGFSQRLPLSGVFQNAIKLANKNKSLKISLDLPSGFDKKTGDSLFKPDIILTLAAPKTELLESPVVADIYVADIGIPLQLYEDLGISQIPFFKSGIVRLAGKNEKHHETE